MTTKDTIKKMVDVVGMDEILYCLAEIEKEKKEDKSVISEIWIEHILDDCPDTSFYGKYTNDLTDGVIVRQYGEFYENLTEDEKEEIESAGREYRCFRPYAGGEEVGTPEYYKYGMEDYNRMEKLNNGDFCFIGIVAKSEIKYHIGSGNYRLETVQSSGLWGIESDSGEDYIKSVEQDELSGLKDHLEKMNVNTSNFEELTKDVEIKERY